MAQPQGFTLVELLVVITVIVILLALLAPAMDQAIYQAELAVCGSRQRSILGSIAAYAMGYKRHYPERGAIRLERHNDPTTVRFTKEQDHFDDTKLLKGYVAMGPSGQLNCPMSLPVDIEGSDAETWVYSPYPLYFGWTLGLVGQRPGGMRKLGDRLTWQRRIGSQVSEVSISVLVTDENLIMPLWSLAHSTHPDGDGKLVPWRSQDEAGTGLETLYKITRTALVSRTTHQRGPVDLNYGFQDGSVQRYDEVAFNEPEREGRIIKVPYQSNNDNTASAFRHIAAR